MDTTPDTATAPAAATPPTVSPLEAAIAAFAATNPVEGKQIMDTIANQQRELETTKTELDAMHTTAVDQEILGAQLTELMGRLGEPLATRFHMGPAATHLMSKNPHIVANAAHRVIAACNAKLMGGDSLPPAKRARPEPVAAEPDEPAPPVALSAAAADTQALLRRAFASNY